MPSENQLKLLILFFILSLVSISEGYGCGIKTTGNVTEGCIPFLVSFKPDTSGFSKQIAEYKWSFGNGDSSNQTAPSYVFNSRGSYKVSLEIIYTDGTTCSSTYSTVNVYGLPIAKIYLPDTLECFPNNRFNFISKSTLSPDSIPIAHYYWNFGDGKDTQSQSPSHHYDSAGIYKISLIIKDSKGCQSNAQSKNAIEIINPVALFKIADTTGCDSAPVNFINQSDTANSFIGKFYWNFGDGSPVDSTHWDPSHIYKKPGIKFFPVLTIKSRLVSCISTYKSHSPVEVIATKIIFNHPDTLCWSDAENGAVFSFNSTPTALNWQINYDDYGPNSKTLYDPLTKFYTVTHYFEGGPGIYCISLNATLSCGNSAQQITENTKLYVKGPLASISYGGGINEYYPATPRSKQVFYDRQKNGIACLGTDTVNYSTFIKTGKMDTIKIAHYCSAKVDSIKYDTTNVCGSGSYPYVSSIGLNPSSVTKIVYQDSAEIFYDGITGANHKPAWNAATDPIPSGTVYFPSGTEDSIYPFVNIKPGDYYPNPYDAAKYGPPMAVHDSNIYLCTGPEMVFFPNFSEKYRLRFAIDDYPPSISPESCKYNINYPYVSDSLTYSWSFNDPDGQQCTTTVANKNYSCNFSNMATPYHYYNENQFPGSGCLEVELTVTDPKTGCSDVTGITLNMHRADVHWDTAQYCKMNWDMQQYLLPSGGPLRGFALTGAGNCTNTNLYIDFDEILPSCPSFNNIWIEPDSASDVSYKCSYTTSTGKQDTVYNYNFQPLWNYYDPNLLWFIMKYGTSGCRTIGIVMKNGDCFDTAWYHNYICISSFSANFNVLSGAGQLLGSTGYSAGQKALCPPDSGLKPTHIRLIPSDTSMKTVTSFSYIVSRREIPMPYSGKTDYYYSVPFWPDTLSFANPYPAFNGSVTSVSDTIRIPVSGSLYVVNNFVSPAQTLYPTNFYLYGARYKNVNNLLGIEVDSFVVDTSKKNEVDFLNRHGFLVLPATDPRSRMLSINCVNTVTDTIYYANGGKGWRTITGAIVYLSNGYAPLSFASTLPFLNLNDPTQDNHVFRAWDEGREINKHDTADFYLPYPGVYSIIAAGATIDGCIDTQRYFYANGHYAQFTADSVTCVGGPTKFTSKVRYFAPLDTVTGDGLDETNINFQDVWDFGDSTPLVKTNNDSILHTYTKPGVYTVSMFSTDANGCTIATIRRNYIKAEQLQIGFTMVPLKDTLSLCAPHYITYMDTSHILLTKYSSGIYARYMDWVKINGKIVLDTITVDTIKTWKWNPGDGRQTVVLTSGGSAVFDYTLPGRFNVYHLISSGHCTDSLMKPQFLHIIGPIPLFSPLDTTECIPFKLSLRINELHGISYLWEKGDGTTESYTSSDIVDSMLHVTYTKPGTFYLYLTQTDTTYVPLDSTTATCTSTWPDTLNPSIPRIKIVVTSPDQLRIIGDTFVCLNQTVKYTVNADTNIASYFWDFGNGGTAYGDSVSTSYNANGNYFITVRATSLHGCVTFDTLKVRVNHVKPNFKMLGDTFVCLNQSVKYTTNADTNVKFFSWRFDNGGNSTGDTVSTRFNAIGKYYITLIATTDSGCVLFDTLKVSVNHVKPNFNIIGDTFVCLNQSVQYTTNADTSVKSFLWNFGNGGNGYTDTVNTNYNTTGKYYITLIATTDSGCVVYDTEKVNVNYVKPNFNIIGDTFVCLNQTASYSTNANSNFTSFSWDFGNGNNAIGDTVSTSYYAIGKYYIALIANTDTGCAIFDTLKVRANNIKRYFNIFGDTLLCLDQNANYNINANLSSLSWNFGNGTTDSGQTVNTSFNSIGNYFIILTATNDSGCVFFDTLNVRVRNVKPDFAMLGDTLVCIDQKAKYSVNANSNYTSFSWDFGNGNTDSGSNVSTSYNAQGNYIITLIAKQLSGCVVFDTLKVMANYVKAIFDVDTFNASSAAFTFYNRSVNGLIYRWKFGNGDSIQKTDSTYVLYSYLSHLHIQNGKYEAGKLDTLSFKVCLEAIGLGCTSDTCQYVYVQRGEEPYNVITPNGDGINDVFMPKYINGTYYHMQIFNRWGQKVFESNDNNNAWNGNLMNTGAPCPAGAYFYIWDYQLIGLPQTTHMGTVTVIR